jgi:glycosyltransferase involved in cell wall biosynthesis
MKFAFFIPYFREGGVETTTYRLAKGFRERGHSVTLLTFGHDSPYLGPNSPFDVTDLDVGRTLTSIPTLVRKLREIRPDVVLSTHYYANIANVIANELARVGARTIVTERLYVSHIIDKEPWYKSKLFPVGMRFAYARADHCVTVSQAAAEDLRELASLSPDEVTAIYNPTLIEDVFERASEPVDHPWFDADEPPVLLGVGRLTGQKDFETLIRAFDEFVETNEARLVILGEGEERDRLEALTKTLGVEDAVDLHGFVDNPYSFMKRADLFVLSSRYEGMPNVLVEAAALETPVVATDCPSGPRELLNDGEAGKLVPVEDPSTMADAIDHQLSNPDEAKERIRGIQTKLEAFRPATSCERYLSLVEGGIES